MELLYETIFKKKLRKNRCNTAIKINNDIKSFSAALLMVDSNKNIFIINNWTVEKIL